VAIAPQRAKLAQHRYGYPGTQAFVARGPGKAEAVRRSLKVKGYYSPSEEMKRLGGSEREARTGATHRDVSLRTATREG